MVQTMIPNVESDLQNLVTEASQLYAALSSTKQKLLDNLRRQQALIGGSSAPAAAPSAAPRAHQNGSTEAAPKKRGGGRKGSNEKSLKQVILDVLELPGHEEGLLVAEIIRYIEDNKLWSSPTVKDITQMVQSQVYNLRTSEKIVRGDNKKYYIPAQS